MSAAFVFRLTRVLRHRRRLEDARALAQQNHYPAVDILQSVSRVMPSVTAEEHRAAASTLRSLLAAYKEAEDLINIGAYAAGSNPRIDRALKHIDAIRAFLCQGTHEAAAFEETVSGLTGMFG